MHRRFTFIRWLAVAVLVALAAACDPVESPDGRTFNLAPDYAYAGDCPGTPETSGIWGETDHAARTVCVQAELPDAVEAAALVHELAHTWMAAWGVDPDPTGATRWDDPVAWTAAEQLAACAVEGAGYLPVIWVDGTRYSIHLAVRCTDQWRPLGADLAFWITATT